ncbi:MAG TPA: class I SAM-dependent methyltransferase [Oleiagrimonas sp.]|nr:class I SAM-dependent methyltransferase [Oleiagrimonas sp.]
MDKTYDRAYFDKWYRDPEHAVASPAEVRRKVALAVSVAEYYLGRPVRNVLDIGCGEAHWRAPLRKLRPKIHYRGLDASEYVVARYGRTRNIGLAQFGMLEHLRFEQPFDLILCTNVLHYIGAAEIKRGLSGLDELLEGVAFLEVFTTQDATEGDDEDYVARPAAWYRRRFKTAGLTPVGSHCYVGTHLASQLLALESPVA